MATVIASTIATTSTRATSKPAGAIIRAGATASFVAASATTVIAVCAKGAGIPLKASGSASQVATAIPLAGFAGLTLGCAAVGILLAVALARRARRPESLFARITLVLTAASLIGPITAYHATTATRLVLALTHVVAAAIVIPPLASRLGHRRYGLSLLR